MYSYMCEYIYIIIYIYIYIYIYIGNLGVVFKRFVSPLSRIFFLCPSYVQSVVISYSYDDDKEAKRTHMKMWQSMNLPPSAQGCYNCHIPEPLERDKKVSIRTKKISDLMEKKNKDSSSSQGHRPIGHTLIPFITKRGVEGHSGGGTGVEGHSSGLNPPIEITNMLQSIKLKEFYLHKTTSPLENTFNNIQERVRFKPQRSLAPIESSREAKLGAHILFEFTDASALIRSQLAIDSTGVNVYLFVCIYMYMYTHMDMYMHVYMFYTNSRKLLP
jgi:hypothetical protein